MDVKLDAVRVSKLTMSAAWGARLLNGSAVRLMSTSDGVTTLSRSRDEIEGESTELCRIRRVCQGTRTSTSEWLLVSRHFSSLEWIILGELWRPQVDESEPLHDDLMHVTSVQ